MTNAVLEMRTIASRQFSPLAAAHTFAAVLERGAYWLELDVWERREQRMDVTPPASLGTTPCSLTRLSYEVQIEQMRTDLAGRLRRVCADMPPQEFATLVSDICAMKLRWAEDARPQR